MGPGPAGISQLEYLFSRVVCVSVPLGFIALLVILVIAGIKYLTSGGEPKAISQAHQTVTWGLLGVVFLAIAWLILQLIQNFTGIEVTKFTLASLPGVEGFTSSCWDSAPTAPTNVASKTNSENISGFSFPVIKLMAPCTDPFEKMSPLARTGNPGVGGYLPTTNNFTDFIGWIAYPNNPLNEPGYLETISRIQRINVLTSEALESMIWWERPDNAENNLRNYLISLPDHQNIPAIAEIARQGKGYYFAKYEKGKVPKDLINTQYQALQVVKKFWSERTPHPDIETFYQSEKDFDSVVLLGYACSDADFYVISTDTPLIYFYPTKTSSIKTDINSPITSSFKQQDGSWNILVDKDGVFEKNGITHHFIPYEFLRKDFRRPTQGFVVDKEHFINFLRDTLWKRLGLTDQEVEDYWNDLKGRIPKSPYYFISLIDRSEIDRILPMEINPKPDTILRNMTYILPLQRPFIPVPLPKDRLKAPDRKGFTVLENGGFIDGF